MIKNRCVVVPRAEGETTRRALVEAGLMAMGLKIRSDEACLYLPVVPDLDDRILSEIAPGCHVSECEFEESEHRQSVEELIGFAPSYEIIGDIAVTTEDYDRKVGEAIMAVHNNVKTVLVPTTGVVGEFRVREFKVLCGGTGRLLHTVSTVLFSRWTSPGSISAPGCPPSVSVSSTR